MKFKSGDIVGYKGNSLKGWSTNLGGNLYIWFSENDQMRIGPPAGSGKQKSYKAGHRGNLFGSNYATLIHRDSK